MNTTRPACVRLRDRFCSRSPTVVTLVCLSVLGWAAQCTTLAQDRPAVFPLPQEIGQTATDFRLDEPTSILVPEGASEQDVFAARLLSAECSDRYQLAIRVRTMPSLPDGSPYIIIGTERNPLVIQALRALGAPAAPQKAEAYTLIVRASAAVVAGHDEAGAFHGLQSLRQLLVRDGQGVRLRGVQIRDWPQTPFRGIRLYLPGRENIAFFKRFLRDFMALYKYNRVIIEMNAAMRFERHPELNAGWIELGRDMHATRRSMLHAYEDASERFERDAADNTLAAIRLEECERLTERNDRRVPVVDLRRLDELERVLDRAPLLANCVLEERRDGFPVILQRAIHKRLACPRVGQDVDMFAPLIRSSEKPFANLRLADIV